MLTAATHNPERILRKKLPSKHRFLNTSEIIPTNVEAVKAWLPHEKVFSKTAVYKGDDSTITYCTNLTPEQLKEKRGLK